MLIEGTTQNVGAYIALMRQYKPQSLRAAVIATLVRKYSCCEGKGGLKKPGGYLTWQVRQCEKTIPEQLMALAKTYEHATYEEIDTALARQAQMQPSRQQTSVLASQDMYRPKRGRALDKATAEGVAQRIA
jgi:hypothetical protein